MEIYLNCRTCGKPIKQEAKRAGVVGGGPGGPRLYCNDSCRGKSQARKIFVTSEDQKAKRRKWRKDNSIRLRQAKHSDAIAAKAEGLKHYGGKCSCCGETTPEFLTIEHKNGRIKNGVRYTGKRAWQDLRRRGWPGDITILCFNCNCAKGAYGECPHQKQKKSGEL